MLAQIVKMIDHAYRWVIRLRGSDSRA
jgi:hypothetical protein